jgi:hypothetical protein
MPSVASRNSIAGGRAVRVDDQAHAAVQHGAGALGGADEGGAFLRRPLAAIALEPLLEPLEGMQDRLLGHQIEQRATEADGVRRLEDLNRGIVVQQDPVLQVADQDAFIEVDENRFQPALLFLHAGGRAGHGLDDVGPGGGQRRSDVRDRRRQPLEWATVRACRPSAASGRARRRCSTVQLAASTRASTSMPPPP